MNINLENAAVYIAIIGFGALVIRCLVSNPLREEMRNLKETLQLSIGALTHSIENLQRCMSIIEDKLDSQGTRITRCEEATKSGHKRLDEHLTMVHKISADHSEHD